MATSYHLILKRSPQFDYSQQMFKLDKDVVTIGRDITNDIIINDSELSRHHARLILEDDGGYIIEDLGSTNGTFINGERVETEAVLTPGDSIALGETITLSYEILASAPASQTLPTAPPLLQRMAATAPIRRPEPQTPFVLKGVQGAVADQIIPLQLDVIRIGRELDNDITIIDSELSRYHARLNRNADGGYTLEDLDSTNGTFINGAQLTGRRVLAVGDRIGFADTVILLYDSR